MTITDRTSPGVNGNGTSSPALPHLFAVFDVAFVSLTPFAMDTIGWVVAAIAVVLCFVHRRETAETPRLSFIVLPYLFWVTLSLVWSVNVPATVVRASVLWMSCLVAWALANGRTLDDLLKVSAQGMLFALLLSWLTAILRPEMGFSQDSGDFGAFKGLLLQKNAMGYFAVAAGLTNIAQVLRSRGRRASLPYAVGAALSFSTVIATRSGTALSILIGVFIAFAVLELAAHLRHPRGLALTLMMGFVVACGGALFAHPDIVTSALDKDPTLTGRTRIWEVVLGAIADRPVNGYGWGALWREGTQVTETMWAENGYAFFHAHNGYLDVTAQLGLVGLTLYAVILLGLLVRTVSSFVQHPNYAAKWAVLLVLTPILYNLTEVVAFQDIVWVLLVAIATISPSVSED